MKTTASGYLRSRRQGLSSVDADARKKFANGREGVFGDLHGTLGHAV
jgi:hypothetical protein